MHAGKQTSNLGSIQARKSARSHTNKQAYSQSGGQANTGKRATKLPYIVAAGGHTGGHTDKET